MDEFVSPAAHEEVVLTKAQKKFHQKDIAKHLKQMFNILCLRREKKKKIPEICQ